MLSRKIIPLARTYACYRRYHGFASYRSTCESYRRSSTVYLLDLQEPDVPRMMEALGVDSFYNNKWGAMGAEIVNPIGCSDCHDPETMNLHISRPALIEAFQRQGKDITKVTPQEMRSLVCAQCHVEYYFKGDGKYLTFPWDKGFTVEDMEAYYDEAGFMIIFIN